MNVERYSKLGIITHTLKVEAGYVKNPKDRGGATRHGVTEKLAIVWRELWDYYNWDGDMRTLPLDLAYEMIDREFWQPLRLDEVHEVNPLLADLLFDWSVNAGRHSPSLAIQEHLNASNREGTDYPDVKEDGRLGSRTLDCMNSYIHIRGNVGVYCMLQYLQAKQTVNYRQMTVVRETQEAFYTGWLTRSFNRMADYMNYLNV